MTLVQIIEYCAKIHVMLQKQTINLLFSESVFVNIKWFRSCFIRNRNRQDSSREFTKKNVENFLGMRWSTIRHVKYRTWMLLVHFISIVSFTIGPNFEADLDNIRKACKEQDINHLFSFQNVTKAWMIDFDRIKRSLWFCYFSE